MSWNAGLTTRDILALFTEEIADHGGTVTDAVHDGGRLFARSVLPGLEEVRRGDQLQGGVALKATEAGVWLHPYVFRLVCRNGAIMAQSVESQHIADLALADEPESMLREAIQACCARDAFVDAAGKFRSAGDTQVDFALAMMSIMSRLPASAGHHIVREILGRFMGDRDRSLFGVMNAVTSLARDTTDPETRWTLEELGGGVPLWDLGPEPTLSTARTLRREDLMGVR